MSAFCLVAIGIAALTVQAEHFTLRWTHSIEKVEWQEDYAVRGDALVLVEARVRGSGAGMEPPSDAVLRGGWWHYDPHLPPLPELRLAVSSFTSDYRLCWAGQCRELKGLLPAGAETVIVRPCPAA